MHNLNPPRRNSGPDEFTGNSTNTQERSNTTLTQTLSKKKEKKAISSLFSDRDPKPLKNITRMENFR